MASPRRHVDMGITVMNPRAVATGVSRCANTNAHHIGQ